MVDSSEDELVGGGSANGGSVIPASDGPGWKLGGEEARIEIMARGINDVLIAPETVRTTSCDRHPPMRFGACVARDWCAEPECLPSGPAGRLARNTSKWF